MKDDFISNETKKTKSMRKQKITNVFKTVLLYTALTVGVLLLLAIAYQIIEFLFTLAILIIAWLFSK